MVELVCLLTSDYGSDHPLNKPHLFFFFFISISVSRKFSLYSVKLAITQVTSLFAVCRYVGWAKPKIFLSILINMVP